MTILPSYNNPTWPSPNYVDPETQGPSILVVNTILLLLTSAAVGTWLYSSYRDRRPKVIEKIFLLLAYATALAFAIIIGIIFGRLKGDRHVYDIETQNVVTIRKLLFIGGVIYSSSTSFTRLALLCFYAHIFTNLRFHRFIQFMIGVAACYGVAWIVGQTLQCLPLKYIWTTPEPGANVTCVDVVPFILALGCISPFLDVILLLIPIRIICTFQASFAEKLQVGLLLLAGFLVCVSASVRIYYLTIFVKSGKDVTWLCYNLYLWMVIECHVGILCVSLPACKNIFKSWNSRRKNSRIGSVESAYLKNRSRTTALVEKSFTVETEVNCNFVVEDNSWRKYKNRRDSELADLEQELSRGNSGPIFTGGLSHPVLESRQE